MKRRVEVDAVVISEEEIARDLEIRARRARHNRAYARSTTTLPDLQSVADGLALLLAKARTRGDVFMDGSHNPLPTERQQARMFVEDHIVPLVDRVADLGYELLAKYDRVEELEAVLNMIRHEPAWNHLGKTERDAVRAVLQDRNATEAWPSV